MNCTRSPKQVDVVLSGPLEGFGLHDRLENGLGGGFSLGNRLQTRSRRSLPQENGFPGGFTLENRLETASEPVLPWKPPSKQSPVRFYLDCLAFFHPYRPHVQGLVWASKQV